MMKKRILGVCVLLTLSFGALPVSASGTTTEISDYSDLLAASKAPNGDWVLTQNIVITLENEETWYGIGGADYVFTGTLNGNDYTITLPEGAHQGLFAEVNGATISNLTIDGSITGTNSQYGIGGVAGDAGTGSTFTNCHNLANITGVTENTIGGIAGEILQSTVSYCTNSGTIFLVSDAYTAGGIVGVIGLAAESAGDHITADPSYVTDCYNTGAVSNTQASAGGIIGRTGGVTATVKQCFNSGSVTVSGSYNSNDLGYAAGIVGKQLYGTLTIRRCGNSGTITSSNDSLHAGGILGKANYTTLSDCYSVGVMDAKQPGGILGLYNDSALSDFFNLVSLTDCYHAMTDENGTLISLISYEENKPTMTTCYGEGKGDTTVATLTLGAALGGFSTDTWTFAQGQYPQLNVFADYGPAIAAVAAAKLDSDTLTLSNITDGKWYNDGTEITSATTEIGLVNPLTFTYTAEGIEYSKEVYVQGGITDDTYDIASATAWLPTWTTPENPIYDGKTAWEATPDLTDLPSSYAEGDVAIRYRCLVGDTYVATTPENSGASDEYQPPVYAGSYQVAAVATGTNLDTLISTVTFDVAPAALPTQALTLSLDPADCLVTDEWATLTLAQFADLPSDLADDSITWEMTFNDEILEDTTDQQNGTLTFPSNAGSYVCTLTINDPLRYEVGTATLTFTLRHNLADLVDTTSEVGTTFFTADFLASTPYYLPLIGELATYWMYTLDGVAQEAGYYHGGMTIYPPATGAYRFDINQ